MSEATDSVVLTPHELAVIDECLRVYADVIRHDLAGVEFEVQFDGALCDENWAKMLVWVEDIRSTIARAKPSGTHAKPAPRQVTGGNSQAMAARVSPKPKKRSKSTATYAKKAHRFGKRIGRWLR